MSKYIKPTKLFIAAAILVTLCSGCHEYHRSQTVQDNFERRLKEPEYTIIVDHHECTGCLDVYVLEGTVGVPKDLQPFLGDTLPENDIILVGNFPFDFIDPRKLFFNPDLKFKLTGKLIGVEEHNLSCLCRYAPVFYVDEWEKIKD